MEILAKLGIDWKLLLAQGVNFVILLLVLKRFAYKPMLDFLQSRAERIEQGIKDADQAKVKLESVLEEEKEILKKAREEARQVVAEAEADAKKRAMLREEQTEAKIASLLRDNEARMTEEREQMLREVKGELSALVMQSVEKVLHEKIDSSKDQELIKKTVEQG